MNTLVRTINPEIRVIDSEKGIVDYVASDSSIDSYQEIVAYDGWDTSQVAKNLPVPDSHNYSTIQNLLGNVIDASVVTGKLVCRVQLAIAQSIGNKLAQLAWGMIQGGFLKACSVGFIPTASMDSWGDNGDKWSAALDKYQVQGSDREKVRTIYTKQSLLELSICILGANPNALLKAQDAGIMTDESLFDLGFKSETDLSFLHDCARVYDSIGQRAQMRVSHSIRALCAANNLSQNSSKHLATSADAPAGVDVALRREQDAAFIEELRKGYEGRAPKK